MGCVASKDKEEKDQREAHLRKALGAGDKPQVYFRAYSAGVICGLRAF